ncbi:MAG: aldolase/citrate lyase family protein [Acidobacteriota bacterium]|nr:aldolase/citrate lyase family protein [Blastocatellia bacterium]MDW8238671.1 aldolase/citrate lyase family protein [Acidobacteriota bacterium]
MKNLRQRLRAGDYVIGSWISSGSPVVAELMAAMGFDFLTVDVEHSAVELPETQALFQAIRSGHADCAPLVRLPGDEYAVTKRYMDAGAAGVIAPLINRPEQVHAIVRAVKYPPLGERGVGFCRANQYGTRLEEAVAAANEETLVCIQIEHVDGLRHLDEILAVPGIDAVLIGPYDLSASMGLTAQLDHPDVLAAKQRILAACRARGLAAGIHVVQPDVDQAVHYLQQGYRMIAYSLDITMLACLCRQGLGEIRRRVPQSASAA